MHGGGLMHVALATLNSQVALFALAKQALTFALLAYTLPKAASISALSSRKLEGSNRA
jgi:hypothetical protein